LVAAAYESVVRKPVKSTHHCRFPSPDRSTLRTRNSDTWPFRRRRR
jgi:hypothetical protein